MGKSPTNWTHTISRYIWLKQDVKSPNVAISDHKMLGLTKVKHKIYPDLDIFSLDTHEVPWHS
jgi:hypothetical protein